MKALSLEQCEKVSEILKSFAHPHRLWILCLLSEGEKHVQEIAQATGLPHPTVSRHLNRMRREGLLTARRQGQYCYYSIREEKLKKFMQAMQ